MKKLYAFLLLFLSGCIWADNAFSLKPWLYKSVDIELVKTKVEAYKKDPCEAAYSKVVLFSVYEDSEEMKYYFFDVKYNTS